MVDPEWSHHWRGVVPSLALGWSHAPGAQRSQVVPCGWRATAVASLGAGPVAGRIRPTGVKSGADEQRPAEAEDECPLA